jgi:hypothetical protein
MRRFLALVTLVLFSTVSSGTSTYRNAAPRAPALPKSVTPHLRHAVGQHANHAEASPPKFSIAVDGRANPAAVSDDIAYIHFLRVMASRTSEGVTRRETVLKDAGLLPSDRAAFSAALGSLGLEMAAVAQQRKAGVPPQQSYAVESKAVGNARTRILSKLSRDGAARLQTYVREHVKRHIVIYRG